MICPWLGLCKSKRQWLNDQWGAMLDMVKGASIYWKVTEWRKESSLITQRVSLFVFMSLACGMEDIRRMMNKWISAFVIAQEYTKIREYDPFLQPGLLEELVEVLFSSHVVSYPCIIPSEPWSFSSWLGLYTIGKPWLVLTNALDS